jgi:MFS family permease
MPAKDEAVPAGQTKVKGRLFYGWWIVAACFLVTMWGAGTFYYGFTAFFKPIKEEFQWGATVTSVAFALRGMESGIADLFVGFLTDRFGPRKVMQIGIIVLGSGFILLGFVNSLWSFYAAVSIIALGLTGCIALVSMTAVANWFVRKRSRALGLLMAGAGAGGLLVPLITWSINLSGWRATAIILGIATWALCLPLSLVVRHKPEQYGYLPDGDLPDNDPPGESIPQLGEARRDQAGYEYSAKEALKTSAFWRLALAYTIVFIGLNGIVPHLIPFLTSRDVGFSDGTAALMVTLMTVSSIAGRLGFGWLGDYIPKRYVLTIAFSLQAAAILIFAYSRSLWQVLLFICLFGPSYGGSIPLRAAIQGDYFGRRAFGSIQGILMAITTIGGAVSPIFAGAIYDATGSYRTAFLVIGLIAAASIPMIFSARPPIPPQLKNGQGDSH